MRKLIPLLLLAVSLRASAQRDTVSNISDTEKLYGLSMFWKEASYNFVYFDKTNINWDSAYQAFIPQVLATKSTWRYYMVMERFCALLKDGHTNINMPGNLMKVSTYYPLVFSWIDGKVIVIGVPKKDTLLVPMGSEVVKVNDLPVMEHMQKNIIPYIAASAPHQLWNDAAEKQFLHADTTMLYKLTLKTPAGKIIEHTTRLSRYRFNWNYTSANYPWKRSRFQELPGGISYVQLNTFGDDSVVVDFKQHLPELYKAKAVIIDLRFNGGGSTGTGLAVLNYFTDQKQIVGSASSSREHIGMYKAWGSFIKDEEDLQKRLKENPFSKAWTMKAYNISRGKYWTELDSNLFLNTVTEPKITVPLVILFGNNTASAAEDFLVALDDLKGRATTVGERSYGSTGQPMSFPLPGGGSARICTKKDTYPDGREFVGYGVKPDIEVKRTVDDYMKHRDAQLEKAIEVVKSKMTSSIQKGSE